MYRYPPSPIGPTVRRGHDGTLITDHGPMPLAALQALGSTVVSVGDVAWDTTHRRSVVCLTAAGTSEWGEFWEYRGAWTLGSAAKRYLRWNAGTVQAGISGLAVLPTIRPLRITRIRFGADSDPGSTTVSVHSARNTTALEDVVVATTGAATFRNFDFSATATIPADGELSVAFTPSNTPNEFAMLIQGYLL